jgi:hypothetical protein
VHTGLTDPKIVPHIQSTIGTAWAYLAALAEWWFMEQPEPCEISVTAGVHQYTISREDVGLMLHVANDSGRRIWVYKARRSYQGYLAFPIFSGAASSDTETSSNVGVFTLCGLKNGKPVIDVRPIPAVAQTAYLHYQEKGTLANLDRLPDAWSLVLFHLTMSLIANPLQEPTVDDKLRWKVLTGAHQAQFEKAYADMVRQEIGATDEDSEMLLESYAAERLEAINDQI